MLSRTGLVLLSLVAVGAAPAEEERVVDPQADAALHRMSNYLGGLGSFRVDATTTQEKVTEEGQKIQEVKESTVMVKRPGQARVDRVGPNGKLSFIDDGKRLTLVNHDTKVYATAPAPAKIDAAIEDARTQLAVDAPGADLFVTGSYDLLLNNVKVGRYIGLEPIAGVMAHHVAMSGRDVDWQIWIQDGASPVPIRYVITSKDLQGSPEFMLDLRNWKPNAALADDIFAFAPPSGARRIDLKPNANKAPGKQF